ncbi:MAG TPA: MFS transporter [Rariglobus sp.]|nr:MFS transporter [Rariglobus sp.]
MSHSSLSDIPAPVSKSSNGSKTWRVGTLTYTMAGLVALFGWLLCGDFAWSMRDRSVAPMAQWYLGDLKVPSVIFGLLLTSFPAFVGLILGPVIAVKSDRHRGKWGRRIPFLLVTTPFAALGMIGLGLTPVLAEWLHGLGAPGSAVGGWLHQAIGGSSSGAWLLSMLENKMVVSVVCFSVFWAAFELATVIGQSVFGGLINDVVPPELLGRFYGLFRAVSLLDGIFFNYWIMGKVPGHFTLILVAIGVFYGAAFMWVCLKVKEGAYPPPAPAEELPRGRVAEVATYFKESFSRPYYVFVFVMLMTGSLSFMPVNSFAIPYASSLGMDMTAYGHCLAVTFTISLCLAYFLGWMADKYHPMRVSMVSLAGYIVVTLAGYIWVKTPESFAIALVAHGVLSGCYFTSAASLGQRLFPRSKFGQFSSAAGLFGSLSLMAIGPAMGAVVDLTGRNYRYTFVIGGLLALVALISAWLVYVRFLRLGGPKAYVAPV